MSVKLTLLPDMHSEQPKIETRHVCQLSTMECWDDGQFGYSKFPCRIHKRVCINSYTASHVTLITDVFLCLHFCRIKYLKISPDDGFA
jgi:hypothetical protein